WTRGRLPKSGRGPSGPHDRRPARGEPLFGRRPRVHPPHARHENAVLAGWRNDDAVLPSANLARDELLQIKGTIVEALAGGNYRVKGDNGMEFLAKIGGRMRRYHIRVIPGDRVTIAVSPYDPTHGLIVFRGG